MSTTKDNPKIEIKHVKHTYTPDERSQLGSTLALHVGELRNINSEFDQVKSNYKSKITEKEAQIDSTSTNLVNGFDMRNERCVVVFFPKEKKKHYYLESAWCFEIDLFDNLEALKPVLVEAMTNDDFQADLIQAESKFEKREEIALFKPTERDFGTLVVGSFMGKWYSALRIRIGKHNLEERLDSEQKSFRHRPDAVKRAGKRALEWIGQVLPNDVKGFEQPVADAVAGQLERVE